MLESPGLVARSTGLYGRAHGEIDAEKFAWSSMNDGVEVIISDQLQRGGDKHLTL